MLLPRIQYHEGVGVRIQYYRLLRCMSLNQLADKCCTKKQYVSAVEKGKRITVDTLIGFARALDVEPQDLLRLNKNWIKLKAKVKRMQKAFEQKRKAEKKARRQKKKWK